MEKSRKPKIRFKGFTDDWEQRKLEEILIQRIQHQKITSNVPLLAFSYAEGVIDPNDKKTNKRDFIMTDKYNKIFSKTEKNDIIYNPANVIHGAIHRNKLGIGVVSPIYKIFICQNINPKFLGERLHTDEFIAEITKYIEGSVIKLRTLSPEQFLDMSIEVPSSKIEQEKIGSMFENLDNLITLHQRKLDKLINVKKSMLEKMFPKQGSTVPEIRFSGFANDWEQRKLGDIADIVGGGTPSTSNEEYWDGEIDWYAPAEITNQIYVDSSERRITEQGFNNSSTKMLPVGTVLFTSRAGIGKMAILRKESCTNQGFQSIVPHKNVLDSYFIFSRSEELKRYGETVGAGSTFVEVSGKQMCAMELMMPQTIDEQRKIGSYFSRLDHLITLHQCELEKLQNIKKSMLEKMFV